MTDLKLENNEGILLQTTDVARYDGNNELEVYELYLTNKNLISVYEKSNGVFAKSEIIVDKIPLDSICVANGIVQVEQVDDDEYGKTLQLVYVNGKRELFELNKKEYPKWKVAITDAVLMLGHGECDIPVKEVTVANTEIAEEKIKGTTEEKRKPKVDKVLAGATAFVAGFKDTIDSAKQSLENATRQFSDSATENIPPLPTAEQGESDMEEKKYIYCSNCGEKMDASAKFCMNCGNKVSTTIAEKDNTETEAIQQNTDDRQYERKTIYEGKVYKCPACGETLNAFTSNCPTCGYELRGTGGNSSVRELAAKLEAIEAKRETVHSNPIKNLYFGQALTKTDEQKISLIRSFTIPNTKEDLYEFLILSESNIDIDMYDDNGNAFKKADARLAVSDAWKAKFEQAYQKAKIIFKDDPRMAEIQSLYDSIHKSIKKARYKTWKFVGLLYAIIIGVLAIIFILVFTLTANSEKKELNRLNDLVSEIEVALENGDYKLALMNADSLDFNGSDEGHERDWERKREYWIDKVLEEAAENGVILERPVDKDDESDTTTQNDTLSNTQNSDRQDEYDNQSDNLNTHNSSVGTPTFSEDSIVKDLKVTEYHLNDDGTLYTILIIDNPSEYNLSITANIKFYNKEGKLIGAENSEADAVEKKTQTIMYFMPDERYDNIEYEFSVSEEDFHDCVVAGLSYESTSAQAKEIISVTNNGTITGEFVEAYALFFQKGNIVGFDSTFITDEDDLIKPGKTITKELDCYTEYDSVQFYFTGHGEW